MSDTESHIRYEADLARARELFGALVIETDPRPEEVTFRNEEAKAAYVGKPFRDLGVPEIRRVLGSAVELSPYELAALLPAVACVALANPDDLDLQSSLAEMSYAYIDDEAVRDMGRGFARVLDEERLAALASVLSHLIARNVFKEGLSETVIVLANLNDILLHSYPEVAEALGGAPGDLRKP